MIGISLNSFGLIVYNFLRKVTFYHIRNHHAICFNAPDFRIDFQFVGWLIKLGVVGSDVELLLAFRSCLLIKKCVFGAFVIVLDEALEKLVDESREELKAFT